MSRSQDFKQKIEALLTERLDAVPEPNANWLEAGMDSLEVIDVCLKLEQELDHEIPVEKFANEMTTEGLVAFLLEEIPE